MRLPRFETFLRQLVTDAASGGRVIATVTTFRDEGMDDPPCGLVFATTHGHKLWLGMVRTSPDGGEDFAAPERISEADTPPAPIETPELALVDGKLHLADVDAWLRALLINSGSRELPAVEAVKLISDNPGHYNRHGLKLRFHNGAAIYCTWRYAVPAGARRLPAEPFKVPEAI